MCGGHQATGVPTAIDSYDIGQRTSPLQPHIPKRASLSIIEARDLKDFSIGYGDLQHLPESHWRWTEAQIGDVKVSIRSERHGGRQRQPCCDLCVLVLAIDSQNLSSSRRRVWIPGRVLKDVQAAFRVESESQNVAETDVNRSEMATGRDLHDFRGAILDGKSIQVPDEEIMSVELQSCGHNVVLDIRNIRDSSNLSSFRDGIEFSVIRLDRIEYFVDGNHAVPCAVWFEVIGFRIGNRMALLESR